MIAVDGGICAAFNIFLYPNAPRRRQGETAAGNATTGGMVIQGTAMPPVDERLGPGVTCRVPERAQLDELRAKFLADASLGTQLDGNVTEACESSGRSRRGWARSGN